MTTLDTYLYDLSIPAISSLQSSWLGTQAQLMQLISVVFDPKYAFLIYSPIVYLVDARVGKRLIMTTVLAEWLNMILKWILHGERPYWYVHSSGHFDAEQTPIQQFAVTCELGPGHPSGHAMVTAAVWYVILSSLLQAYQRHAAAGQNQQHARELVASGARLQLAAAGATWTAYGLLLALVSVSRVFLGCHFPHQCAAGASLGLLVAKLVASRSIKPAHLIVGSGALFVSAFGTYAALEALGKNPNWTIKLATTHCAKREYIHLDTAPFFSIMRYCGFALGAGLGLALPPNRSVFDTAHTTREPLVKDTSRYVSWLSLRLVMALLMARLVDNLALFVSHTNLNTYYATAFGAYTAFSYALVNL